MTDPGPADPYPWLPLATVLSHLGVAEGSPNTAGIDRARRAAALYVEDNRAGDFALLAVLDEDGDPVEVDGEPLLARAFMATDRLVEGALLAVARLDARKGSPNGLANYGEFATSVLRSDPDVERMLGLGRYAKPAIG